MSRRPAKSHGPALPSQVRDAKLKGTITVPPEEAHKLEGIRRPYAMELVGDCMAPAILSGDKIVCDPDAFPRRGEMMLIYPKDGSQGVAKQFVTITDRGIVGQMLNPLRRMLYPWHAIAAVHRGVLVIPPEGVTREVALGPLVEDVPVFEMLRASPALPGSTAIGEVRAR